MQYCLGKTFATCSKVAHYLLITCSLLAPILLTKLGLKLNSVLQSQGMQSCLGKSFPVFNRLCYMFGRLYIPVQQAMLRCSVGYATLFSCLCYPVQQAMLLCSAGNDTLFSRLCYPVNDVMTCSQIVHDSFMIFLQHLHFFFYNLFMTCPLLFNDLFIMACSLFT